MRPVVILLTILLLSSSFLKGDETDSPAHLRLARELLASLSPDRNTYFAKPTRIVWPDEAEETNPVSNASVCSSFCAALLRKTYDLDGGDMARLFEEEWPEADEIFAGVSKRREFDVISSLEEARPGDFLVIDYRSNKEIPTGHVMLISREPESVTHHSSDQLPFSLHEDATSEIPDTGRIFEWHVPVIDSSKGPHGKKDTRYRSSNEETDGEGVGEGPIRLLTDRDGNILGYTWSTFANSKLWLAGDRPMVIARWKP